MFKKSIFLTLALTYSLTAVGCGGSVNSAGGADMPSSLAGGGMEALGAGGGGLEPIEPIGGEEGALPVEGGFDDGGFTEEALPAEQFPAEELPAEELPAEEFPSEELPAEELPVEDGLGDLPEGDGLGDIPEMGGDDLGELPELGGDDNPFESGGGGSSDGYNAEGNFKIDRDRFNQWQAVNVVSDGSTLYVAAVDVKTPSKGTVITMDSSSGESWKDLGSGIFSTITLGALGYDMSKTITGIATDGAGNLVVNDSTSGLFQLSGPKYSVNEISAELNNANDMVEINGSYYVSTGIGILKYDSSLSASTVLGPVVPTGGIGKDSQGNLYAVVGSSVQRVDANGDGTPVISDLSSPVDVTVDNAGNIFVLEADKISFYNASGESQGSFGVGEITTPKAIFADSTGAVYVADFGTSHDDSQIIKFSKGGGGFSTQSVRKVSTLNAPDAN